MSVERLTLSCRPGRRQYRDGAGGPDDVPTLEHPDTRQGWRLILADGRELVDVGQAGRDRLEAVAAGRRNMRAMLCNGPAMPRQSQQDASAAAMTPEPLAVPIAPPATAEAGGGADEGPAAEKSLGPSRPF